MTPQEVEGIILRRDLLKLRSASSDMIEAYLISVFDHCDAAIEPPDVDRLMSLGILIVRAKPEIQDRGALRWLQEAPSIKRLDIVSAFLCGLWHPQFRSKPVGADVVKRLVEIREKLNPDVATAYNYTLALCRVAEDPSGHRDVKAMVSAILRQISQRGLEDIRADSLIRNAIDRVLNRSI